ncbi:unnamed protein product [Moneuplotes crassus]|uniref:Uncharacterized protein n=1 Tax=Euplotes crassus TaxID=5936 RepID=A0AAD1UBG8_EUPCR|nr:unnamed protein product [Moneuplotes crassus]
MKPKHNCPQDQDTQNIEEEKEICNKEKASKLKYCRNKKNKISIMSLIPKKKKYRSKSLNKSSPKKFLGKCRKAPKITKKRIPKEIKEAYISNHFECLQKPESIKIALPSVRRLQPVFTKTKSSYLHYQHQESSFCPSSHSTHPLAPKPSLPATLGRSMTESLKNLQMSLKSHSVEAQAPRGGMGEDRGVGQQWGRRVGEDKFVKLQFPMGVGGNDPHYLLKAKRNIERFAKPKSMSIRNLSLNNLIDRNRSDIELLNRYILKPIKPSKHHSVRKSIHQIYNQIQKQRSLRKSITLQNPLLMINIDKKNF